MSVAWNPAAPNYSAGHGPHFCGSPTGGGASEGNRVDAEGAASGPGEGRLRSGSRRRHTTREDEEYDGEFKPVGPLQAKAGKTDERRCGCKEIARSGAAPSKNSGGYPRFSWDPRSQGLQPEGHFWLARPLLGQLQLDLLPRRIQLHDVETANLAGAGGLVPGGCALAALPLGLQHGTER